MALSPALMSKLAAHLQKKWATSVCPMCRANSWEVHGHIAFFLADAPAQLPIGAPTLPCAAVVCQNCGNTIFVNLVALGLLPGDR